MENEELTLAQIIRGFILSPLSIEDSAKGLASYLSRKPNTYVLVDRIEGTVAYFIQEVKLDDFENFRMRGYMGSPWRYEKSSFEIDFSRKNV